MKKLLKKKSVWIALIILLILFGSFYASENGKQKEKFEFVKIEKGDIIREVSVVGSVFPVDQVDLSFEQSGRVSYIAVKAGDKVSRGKLLASLSNADIGADIASAEARVESEQARLNQFAQAIKAQEIKLEELMNGARKEEIAILEATLNTAETDYQKTISDSANTLKDASSDLLYSVNSTLGVLFRGQQTTSFSLAFNACDIQKKTQAEWERQIIGDKLNLFASNVSKFESSGKNAIYSMFDNAVSITREVESFAFLLSQILSEDCSRSDSSLDSYRTSVNSALLSVSAIRDSILTHKQLLSAKESTQITAFNNLQLALLGPRKEIVDAQISALEQAKTQYEIQKAQIKQAKASLQNIEARAEKTVIRAPISGVIVKKDIRLGEIIQAYFPVFRLSSDADYEIETFISETDIGDVEIGQKANVELDAYGQEQKFRATIVEIEASETLVDGVPTYKTKLVFDENDARIKSGMTADIDILTGFRENVLRVPSRAVIRKDDKKIIRVMNEFGEVEEKDVFVGMKGSDGEVEISGGNLKQGDEIILFEKE